MDLSKRQLLAAVTAVGAASAYPVLGQTTSGTATPDNTTVVVHARSPMSPTTMSRIAISPDGQRIAYVTGRASEQSLAIIDLSTMEQTLYRLGNVFLTEMMWGSNAHIMVRERMFVKGERNKKPVFFENGYTWQLIDLDNRKQKPISFNTILTETSRVETDKGFGLIFQNRIKSIPAYTNIENMLNSMPYGRQLRFIQQLAELQNYINNPLEYDNSGFDNGNLPEGYENSRQSPNDEFDRLDFTTLDRRPILKLDGMVSRAALSADGKIMAYSVFSKTVRSTKIWVSADGSGKKESFKLALDREAFSRADICLEGMGHAANTVLVSEEHRQTFFEIDLAGNTTTVEGGPGKPIFDGYSHLHIGYIFDTPEAEPRYFDPKWVKIWQAVKSMAPPEKLVAIESHARDSRVLVASVRETTDKIYYFIDLSNGRTELLMAAPPESAADNTSLVP